MTYTKKTKVKAEIIKCDFCKEKFDTDDLLFKHLCEKKRRFQQRDLKVVQFAFALFTEFVKKKGNKKLPTIESFENSSMYSSFVGFATHLNRICAIDALGFIKFLLDANIGINKWKQDHYYERWIRERSKTQPPLEAMQQSISLMEQWSVETGEHWTEFFSKIEIPRALLWIKSGKLSPWLILSVPEASSVMLKRMSPEQLVMVEELIDFDYWQIKLDRYPDDVDYMKTIWQETIGA